MFLPLLPLPSVLGRSGRPTLSVHPASPPCVPPPWRVGIPGKSFSVAELEGAKVRRLPPHSIAPPWTGSSSPRGRSRTRARSGASTRCRHLRGSQVLCRHQGRWCDWDFATVDIWCLSQYPHEGTWSAAVSGPPFAVRSRFRFGITGPIC